MNLIGLGYYEAAHWKKTLEELSRGDASRIGSLIPPAFAGRTVEERLDTYTEELARRVRQMDPHAVTVERIANDQIEAVPERSAVKAFLAKAEFGDDAFDIVIPPQSILAEPPVALVDANVDEHGTRKVA